MEPQVDIRWFDRGVEPKCPPNPKYPLGIDLGVDIGRNCKVALPYPAKRCGYYVVRCERCGYTIGVTTAGRPDDPRSIRLPCDGELQ